MDVTVAEVDVLYRVLVAVSQPARMGKEKGGKELTLRNLGNSAPRSPRLRRCCCDNRDSPSYGLSLGGPRESIAMGHELVIHIYVCVHSQVSPCKWQVSLRPPPEGSVPSPATPPKPIPPL